MSLIPQPQTTSVSLKEKLKSATAFEVRLAVAMLYHPTPEAAARHLKISADVVKDTELMTRVDEILEIIKENIVESSYSLMEHFLPKAIAVKAQALDSLNEKIRQDGAEYLIDRFLGRPASNANINVRQKTSQTVYHMNGIDPKVWEGPLDPEDIIEGVIINHDDESKHSPD